ncbi:DUF1499 domain-containing protein [Roseibium aquae]|nr:DUF1499 domain-containing protein [Roseibium aquae]
MKRYARYRSSLAPFGRTVGALSVAIAVLSVLLHRFGLIEAWVMSASLAVAAGFGLTAAVIAFLALRRLWRFGGSGYLDAQLGAVLGLAGAAPVCVVAWVWIFEPPLTDVATDPSDPPVISQNPADLAVEDQAAQFFQDLILERARAVTGQLAGSPDGDAAAVQRALYEDIVPRRYRMPPARLHAAMRRAAEARGWVLTDELPPDLPDAETRAQYLARSPVLGIGADIGIRIRPDPVGALLDVRSVSRSPVPDFTGNADRIRSLLAEIDLVLIETYGDLARLAVLEDELEEMVEGSPSGAEPEEDAAPQIPTPAFKPYFETEDGLPEGEGDLPAPASSG